MAEVTELDWYNLLSFLTVVVMAVGVMGLAIWREELRDARERRKLRRD